MNVERIRRRLSEQFKPFALCLSDGRKFPILHPDFIAVGRNVVIVIDDEDFGVTIDPRHIVSLDDVRAKNGKKKE